MPRKQPQAADQNQGIKGIQGKQYSDELLKFYEIFSELCRQNDGQVQQQHPCRQLFMAGAVHRSIRGPGR